MSQLREKQKKTKDNSFVWRLIPESDMARSRIMLRRLLKQLKFRFNIATFSSRHAIRLESSPSSIEHTTFLLAAILENLARKKTGSDTVTSAYTKIYGYERPHVSGYTAYTEISTLESVYRNLRIHRAYTADTCGRQVYPHKKICGYKNLRIRVDGA